MGARYFPFRGLGEPGVFMGYVLLMGLLPNPSGVLTSVVLSPAVAWDSSILNRIVAPFATWWVSS